MAITYPINESDRFTVYNTETSAPLNDGKGKPMRGVAWGSVDKSQMISGLADNIKWLIEVSEPRPSFDPLTQKINRLPVSYDVANETATLTSYEIIELTQDEIDAKIPAHFTTSQGIKLDVSLDSQNAFTRMMTLIEQAQMPAEQEVKVQDVLKETHTITVGELKTELVSYGLHCYELFHAVPEVDPDLDMI